MSRAPKHRFAGPANSGCWERTAGIQSADGKIFFTTNSDALGQLPFLYWSEDYGETYKASKSLPQAYSDVGECGIAFLKSAQDGKCNAWFANSRVT